MCGYGMIGVSYQNTSKFEPLGNRIWESELPYSAAYKNIVPLCGHEHIK